MNSCNVIESILTLVLCESANLVDAVTTVLRHGVVHDTATINRVEVKVNIREVFPSEIDESLKHEMREVHRVDFSDTQQPANETARCRPSCRADSNICVF